MKECTHFGPAGLTKVGIGSSRNPHFLFWIVCVPVRRSLRASQGGLHGKRLYGGSPVQEVLAERKNWVYSRSGRLSELLCEGESEIWVDGERGGS